jgi:hypothetical protein
MPEPTPLAAGEPIAATDAPIASRAPHHRVGARRVRKEVLVLGVVLPVHLGRRQAHHPARPMHVGAVWTHSTRRPISRLGRVGPESVLGWVGLVDRCRA